MEAVHVVHLIIDDVIAYYKPVLSARECWSPGWAGDVLANDFFCDICFPGLPMAAHTCRLSLQVLSSASMPKDITRRSNAGFSKLGHAFPVELYEETKWYACRTHARAEKKVDELLGRAEFETYLPLIVRERQWADRKKQVAFPLFPGYTFAEFDLTRYHEVLATPGLVTV